MFRSGPTKIPKVGLHTVHVSVWDAWNKVKPNKAWG